MKNKYVINLALSFMLLTHFVCRKLTDKGFVATRLRSVYSVPSEVGHTATSRSRQPILYQVYSVFILRYITHSKPKQYIKEVKK